MSVDVKRVWIQSEEASKEIGEPVVVVTEHDGASTTTYLTTKDNIGLLCGDLDQNDLEVPLNHDVVLAEDGFIRKM